MHRIVYLPCELKARDLPARMALADGLVRRGFTVVVGQQWSIMENVRTAAPGLLVLNTVNRVQASAWAQARAQGFVVFGSDQEALAFADDRCLMNVHPDALRMCDLFLAASEAQAAILRGVCPEMRLRVVGSPRIDVLRRRRPPRPIEPRYVLFNTGLALLNTIWGSTEAAMRMIAFGGSLNDHEIETRLALERAVREEIVALIKWSAANLPAVTVVRPHPNEDPESWRALAIPNCHVVAGAPTLPWITHADLVVHANSTTGLEAAILGRPCINLSPHAFDHWTDRFVMRQCNVTARSAQHAVDLIVGAWPALEKLRPPRKPPFPARAVEKTVACVEEHLAAAAPVHALSWRQTPRHEGAQRKFSVSQPEFAALTRGRVAMLDESLALITP